MSAKPEPFWIARIAAGQPARLRNPGESAKDYRIAMGWDQPKPDPELEPCPFCGGDSELDTRQGYAQFPPNGKSGTRITVYCRDCGSEVGVCREDVPDITPEAVVEMWNRRTPARVDDLAALVSQLVHALRKAAPGHALAERALDYLKRKGLQGSPLRAGVQGTSLSGCAEPNHKEQK
jgi:hypothetical protein